MQVDRTLIPFYVGNYLGLAWVLFDDLKIFHQRWRPKKARTEAYMMTGLYEVSRYLRSANEFLLPRVRLDLGRPIHMPLGN